MNHGNFFGWVRPDYDHAYEYRCGRCGSDGSFEDCEDCYGTGVSGHECGEDTCSCTDPEDNIICATCLGTGVFFNCLPTVKWCETHPLPGRENILSGTVEWVRMKKGEKNGH